jgi:hypothetical protein
MNSPRYESGTLGAPLVVVNQCEPLAGECLMPHPPGTPGARLYDLARAVWNLSDRPGNLAVAHWLTLTERFTLCVGEWSLPEAHAAATSIVALAVDRPILCLGGRVYRAFLGDCISTEAAERDGAYLIPHPSRRNRAWHVPGTYIHALRVIERWYTAAGL